MPLEQKMNRRIRRMKSHTWKFRFEDREEGSLLVDLVSRNLRAKKIEEFRPRPVCREAFFYTNGFGILDQFFELRKRGKKHLVRFAQILKCVVEFSGVG